MFSPRRHARRASSTPYSNDQTATQRIQQQMRIQSPQRQTTTHTSIAGIATDASAPSGVASSSTAAASSSSGETGAAVATSSSGAPNEAISSESTAGASSSSSNAPKIDFDKRYKDNATWLAKQRAPKNQLGMLKDLARFTEQDEFKMTFNDLQQGFLQATNNELRPTKKGYQRQLDAVTPAAKRKNVTFEQSPCFVFALAGYQMSEHANRVSEACDRFGIEVQMGKYDDEPSSSTGSIYDQRLAQVREKLRTSAAIQRYVRDGAGVNVTIYGEFPKGSSSSNTVGVPAHAWIEVDGYILETWPNKPMTGQPATSKSRVQPNSIRDVPRNSYNVGRHTSYLTLAQAEDIQTWYPGFFEGKREPAAPSVVDRADQAAAASSSAASMQE